MKTHRFPYRWKISETKFTKDKGTVFSCFACGGGSSFGCELPTHVKTMGGFYAPFYKDYMLAGSYPLDYDFLGQQPKYYVGMSVPPVAMAQISSQWLSKSKL